MDDLLIVSDGKVWKSSDGSTWTSISHDLSTVWGMDTPRPEYLPFSAGTPIERRCACCTRSQSLGTGACVGCGAPLPASKAR